MKILLIDDDAFLRDMYATKFTECGHIVDTAENAVITLSKLQQTNDFDIILLDMVMPGMSGTELINEIKTRYPEVRAKFVVLSNQGQQEDVDAALAAGASGYIIKAESIPSDVVKKIEDLNKT